MCGRYVIARAVGDLVAETGAVPDESLGAPAEHGRLRASWNTAPTTDVPIVLERLVDGGDDDGELVRELHVARWGLVPGWAKDPAVGSRMFNARSETVLEKPSFRKAVRARRCAVPANGYYEWKKEPAGGGRKQPYYVHPADPEETIWFAGIYEWWRVPEGTDLGSGALQPGRDGAGSTWLLSCSILTTGSPEPAAEHPVLGELHELHDRMPVPLAPEHVGDWLRPGEEDAAQLVDLVRAEAHRVAARWVLDPVGPAVGNVRNNSPELVVPQQGLF